MDTINITDTISSVHIIKLPNIISRIIILLTLTLTLSSKVYPMPNGFNIKYCKVNLFMPYYVNFREFISIDSKMYRWLQDRFWIPLDTKRI